jgi:hypothetical protein
VDKKLLEVKPKESVQLNIQAWRLQSDGSVTPAPEAAIEVNLPTSTNGLVVAPGAGQDSLRCAFSVPKPSVCAELPVSITAVAGVMKIQATVTIKIVSLYELALSWHDSQQTILQADAKEIYALAELTATPMPDPQTTPDSLAEKIKLAVNGANSSLVELKTAPPGLQSPFVQKGILWIPIRATAPAQQDGSPTLIARFIEKEQRLEESLALELVPDLVLGVWAQGKKQADVIYNDRTDPTGWFFGGITVYFHTPLDENKPITPGFKSDIGNPEIFVEPADILELRDYGEERPGWYTGDVSLRSGEDLEKYFGEDLTE